MITVHANFRTVWIANRSLHVSNIIKFLKLVGISSLSKRFRRKLVLNGNIIQLSSLRNLYPTAKFFMFHILIQIKFYIRNH